MKQGKLYLISALMVALGLYYDLRPYFNGILTESGKQLMIENALYLLLYALPLLFLFRKWQSRYGISPFLLPIAILIGWFGIGWMAGELNYALEQTLKSLVTPDFFNQWGTAISAPLVEEPLKLLAAYLSLMFISKEDKASAILAGAGAGLGFQLSEDITYITNAAITHPNLAPSETFLRVINSFTSHWMMTAVLIYGFVLIYNDGRYRKGGFFIATVFFYHFLWNSPLSDLVIPWALHLIILSLLFFLIFLWTLCDFYHTTKPASSTI